MKQNKSLAVIESHLATKKNNPAANRLATISKELLLLSILVGIIGCGGGSGLGKEANESSGDGDDTGQAIQSPTVSISSGEGEGGITVSINIDGNNQGGIGGGSEGEGNGGSVAQDQDNSVTTTTVTEITEGVTTEEERVLACNRCIDNLAESDECECLRTLACTSEDVGEDKLEDLLTCQQNPEVLFG